MDIVIFGPDFVNVCSLSRSIISQTWNQHFLKQH